MFPWRTIDGQECSGYWPASTAALHVNADIAHAATQYVAATGDLDFERDTALPLLVATARLWASAGHHDPDGGFRIDGVTGPDEYSALADNNVYTNLMAQHNLDAAAGAAARHPGQARRLGVRQAEVGRWRQAAAAMVIPYDTRLGVHPQNEGFTNHAEWDFTRTDPERYPLMLHFPYFELYRRQVVKQADLVLAMHLCPDRFTAEQKARNFAYYEPRTVRDSSLSAATQAVLAAEVGHLELAHRYLGEAALIDLADFGHNTRDGMHLASLAGAWSALVAGLGGMRVRGDRLTFAPRLPPSLARVVFRLCFRRRRLQVTVRPANATYRLLAGPSLTLWHHGTETRLDTVAVTLAIPTIEPGPLPAQPPGRAPAGRLAQSQA
jgi:alpha,alpha-trehalose phosphorylase